MGRPLRRPSSQGGPGGGGEAVGADEVQGSFPLDAGPFSVWLDQVLLAISGEGVSEVPCGGCTACCTSSQFVHIGPEETDTLSHVPPELRFPAPRMPRGHALLGYDENGHCPLLGEAGCSIYAHRPRTCRTYDCRIFPAAGLEIADEDKARITRQARRWRFTFPESADRVRRDAVRAAAAFLKDHRELLPEEVSPRTVTQLAVLAVEIHDLFLARDDETGCLSLAAVDPETVRDEVMRRRLPS